MYMFYCLFHGNSFKGFLLFFLFSDWLKSNHLRSWIECGFLTFLRHICSAVIEKIYATSFGAKKCSKNQVRSCWNDSWSVEPTFRRQMQLLWTKTSVFHAVFNSLLKTMIKNRNTLWIFISFSKNLTWSKPQRPGQNFVRKSWGMWQKRCANPRGSPGGC